MSTSSRQSSPAPASPVSTQSSLQLEPGATASPTSSTASSGSIAGHSPPSASIYPAMSESMPALVSVSTPNLAPASQRVSFSSLGIELPGETASGSASSPALAPLTIPSPSTSGGGNSPRSAPAGQPPVPCRHALSISVEVIEAKDLKERYDTYCTITVNQEEKFRTKSQLLTHEPEFNEQFYVPLEVDFRALDVVLWDEKRLISDRALGRVSFTKDFLRMRSGKMLEQWYPLSSPGSDSVVSGDVKLEMGLIPGAQPGGNHRLIVSVSEARDLLGRDSATPPDTYVTLHMFPDEQMALPTRATRVFLRSSAPKFQQTFEFEFAGDVGTHSLHVALWDHARYPGNDFMGHFSVSMADLPENWTISEWFPLLPPPSGLLQSLGIKAEDGRPLSFIPRFRRNRSSTGGLSELLSRPRTFIESFQKAPLDQGPMALAAMRGSIRLRVSYSEEYILERSHYLPLVRHISRRDFLLSAMLGRWSAARESLSLTLMRVFDENGILVPFLHSMIRVELAQTTDVNTLFRANSLASKGIDVFMKASGHAFLVNTIGQPVRDLILSKKSFEVDPMRLAKGEDIDKNWKNIEHFLGIIIKAIINSVKHCPPAFSLIFSFIQAEVIARFPDSTAARYTSISGFFFLRFFCPAILGPKLFGLWDEAIDPRQARGLTLIAKIIQSMANLVEFGNKEAFMTPINDVIYQYIPSIKELLDEISSPLPEFHVSKLPKRMISWDVPNPLFSDHSDYERQCFRLFTYLETESKKVSQHLDPSEYALFDELQDMLDDLREKHRSCEDFFKARTNRYSMSSPLSSTSLNLSSELSSKNPFSSGLRLSRLSAGSLGASSPGSVSSSSPSPHSAPMVPSPLSTGAHTPRSDDPHELEWAFSQSAGSSPKHRTSILVPIGSPSAMAAAAGVANAVAETPVLAASLTSTSDVSTTPLVGDIALACEEEVPSGDLPTLPDAVVDDPAPPVPVESTDAEASPATDKQADSPSGAPTEPQSPVLDTTPGDFHKAREVFLAAEESYIPAPSAQFAVAQPNFLTADKTIAMEDSVVLTGVLSTPTIVRSPAPMPTPVVAMDLPVASSVPAAAAPLEEIVMPALPASLTAATGPTITPSASTVTTFIMPLRADLAEPVPVAPYSDAGPPMSTYIAQANTLTVSVSPMPEPLVMQEVVVGSPPAPVATDEFGLPVDFLDQLDAAPASAPAPAPASSDWAATNPALAALLLATQHASSHAGSLAAGLGRGSTAAGPTGSVSSPHTAATPLSPVDDLDSLLQELEASGSGSGTGSIGSVASPGGALVATPAAGQQHPHQPSGTSSSSLQPVFANNDPTQPVLQCAACAYHIELEEEYLSWGGFVWHTDHFTCSHCDCSLTGSRFYFHNRQLYCSTHFEALFSCGKCGDPVSTDVVEALGKKWHANCFCCTDCGMVLSSNFMADEHRMPYCRNHFLQSRGMICRVCTQLVSSDFVRIDGAYLHTSCFTCQECASCLSGKAYLRVGDSTYMCADHYVCFSCKHPISDGQAVSALGKKFHVDHFNCTSCGNTLIDQQLYERGGIPLCYSCF
ncbi:hypothetical protein H696_03440 [Fonticula alba]|uniref:Ras-GAP domain-containing protein n=1 Tax=Fonticula alba TaxID=691883 RepID=A0A058Z6W5_FONAL|nr:hypothetical protein H696_03440 [Fonticula alba]KCV69975.1 hypothetical protein H696_03440 [Fonticula alba]|eukprot:XP_009495581.1 hypothetical protein H696_03440 [Fonticula alba]